MTGRPRFEVVVTGPVFPGVQTGTGLPAGIAALRAGRPRAAAPDVPGAGPPAPGRIPGGLPNLIVTRHMAQCSGESIAGSRRKAATQVINVLTGGQPDCPVPA